MFNVEGERFLEAIVDGDVVYQDTDYRRGSG